MGRYMTEQETDIRILENETAKKKQDLVRKRAELLAEYTAGSDEIKDIDAQIKALDDSIAGAIEKNRRELGRLSTGRATKTILENLRDRILRRR